MESESENIDIDDTGQETSPSSTNEQLTVCYCGGKVDSGMLKCFVCKALFHVSCLKNGRPSNLRGDVFFDYTCVKCSEDGSEKCQRRQLNWLQVVYLALYNLICGGSGRRGYFRWKDDLCQFIDANWTTFHADRKRTSSWFSTVAGILSTNCPRYFKNGQKQFREGGWWTLQEVLPPSERLELTNGGVSTRRKKKSAASVQTGGAVKNTRASERKRKLDGREVEEGAVLKVEKTEEVEKESLAEVDDVDPFEGFLENSAELLELDIGDVGPMDGIFDDLEDASGTPLSSSFADANISEKSDSKSEKSETKSEICSLVEQDVKQEGVIVLDPEEITSAQSVIKATEPCKRGKLDAEQAATQAQQLRAMQPHEEQVFLEKLSKLSSRNTTARRLRRKLLLRQRKRQCGLPIFDLDGFVERTLTTVSHYVLKDNEAIPVMLDPPDDTALTSHENSKKRRRTFRMMSDRVLDRFMALPQPVISRPAKPVSFLSRLVGSDQRMLIRAITSPYTSRILKPFIRRDFEAMPSKVKLLKEICLRYGNLSPDPDWKLPVFGPIDYCYVQPHHVPGVNALCREFFWPGIDLSECLQYPDFSCVVLYKRLIIGCAFMVPDVKCNEAYISFIVVHPDWRRAGIGSFMMYHLMQTCLGKDVTLHVSPNNPAMIMYQKFGFKPERFAVDFYDRYLTSERRESKHAFFLRLQR